MNNKGVTSLELVIGICVLIASAVTMAAALAGFFKFCWVFLFGGA